MHLCRFLHPGRDIDCAAIDADGPLRIALLADHDLAAMDTDPEEWHDAKLLQKIRLLVAVVAKMASITRKIRLSLMTSRQSHSAMRPSPLYR